MPHLIIEYSANLDGRLELDKLFDALYATALESGVFPIGGLRMRAQRVEHYRIADCHPDNAFVHVTAIIGHGRPLDVRERVSRALFATLTEALDSLYRSSPLAISFHMQEFHPQLNLKRNNLHEHVARRRGSVEKQAS